LRGDVDTDDMEKEHPIISALYETIGSFNQVMYILSGVKKSSKSEPNGRKIILEIITVTVNS